MPGGAASAISPALQARGCTRGDDLFDARPNGLTLTSTLALPIGLGQPWPRAGPSAELSLNR